MSTSSRYKYKKREQPEIIGIQLTLEDQLTCVHCGNALRPIAKISHDGIAERVADRTWKYKYMHKEGCPAVADKLEEWRPYLMELVAEMDQKMAEQNIYHFGLSKKIDVPLDVLFGMNKGVWPSQQHYLRIKKWLENKEHNND